MDPEPCILKSSALVDRMLLRANNETGINERNNAAVTLEWAAVIKMLRLCKQVETV
jgi:hypothetical protein